MKRSVIILFIVLLVVILGILIFYPQSSHYINKIFEDFSKNVAAVFFRESATATQLKEKYNLAIRENTKLHILIVPGHEPDFGGAEYGNLKERDLNTELAGYLKEFLKSNNRYNIISSRDKNGWNPQFLSYFNENSGRINAFISENKNNMLRLINDGSVVKVVNNIKHNTASPDVAIRLFGINMWANENRIDIIINIHFNDYARRSVYGPGKYSGFSIYVPEKQYSNSTTTNTIADAIYKRLEKYNSVSDLPKENAGVVEEQNLISIGSYNTLNAPSMLIEYGYIYEPQFTNPEIRKLMLKDLAFQTYLGLQDFFGDQNTSYTYDTLMLPYTWSSILTKIKADENDTLALQTALIVEGIYPADGKSKNDCPRTGIFGECTINALNIFQKKHEISGEKNKVGEQTQKILNEIYSI